MATLTRKNQNCNSYVMLEPETTRIHTAPSPEWAILQELRSHHQRLGRKTSYAPLKRSVQDTSSIKHDTDLTLCEIHLRQILARDDLETIVRHKLKEQEQIAQSHLASLCSLLDRLTNSIVLLESLENKNPEGLPPAYPRLLNLTWILKNTKWGFDLITGQRRVLFDLKSEQDADEAKRIIGSFDEFFSQSMILPVRVQDFHQKSSEVRNYRHVLRDQAVKGLESLLLHVPQDQSQTCRGHKILIGLPDWNVIEKQTKSQTELKLFLSTCGSAERWHEGRCAVRSSEASDDEDVFDVCDVCEELSHASTSGIVFRFIARDKSLFISSDDDDDEQPSRPDFQPAKSLDDLIEGQSFCETRNITPLMSVKRTQRFNEKQRRALASRLALSLSLFLNSDYALNTSDTTAVFFVVENGRCKLDLVYATSDANKHDLNAAFNDSMSVYNDLARALLEIEYGVSLKTKELGDLKTWVDDMLVQGLEEARSDLININNIGASTSYLTAVRDLLNFKRTYRKGSKRFKGRVFDIGAIAAEIIYSDVAKRLQSCIQPTQLHIVGLENSKDELLSQPLEQANTGEEQWRNSVKRSAIRTTAFQLFDDKEEFEEDRGEVHSRTLALEKH